VEVRELETAPSWVYWTTVFASSFATHRPPLLSQCKLQHATIDRVGRGEKNVADT
jgi:hypothetical protein